MTTSTLPRGRTRRGAAVHPGRLGVLGGMGPLASAEFLRTIYAHAAAVPEQELPSIALLSDPGFPDRTEAFLAGRADDLVGRLVGALEELGAAGADRVVICCVTLHHLLPRLPHRLRGRVLSLLDVAFAELERLGRPHLLVCTTGTRAMRIFESHPAWERARHLVLLPDEAEQRQVHDCIYGVLKRGGDPRVVTPLIRALLDRHGVHDLIAGCTELHLMRAELNAPADGLGPVGVLDPLTLIAARVAAGLPHAPAPALAPIPGSTHA